MKFCSVMTSKCLIFPIIALFFVCCLAACEKHEVTEEAREQARQSEGIYDVEGQMILSPFRDDTVPKRISFNGVAHATDLGEAMIHVAYKSDKMPDTARIQVEIDGEGNLLFKTFTLYYEGISATANMHQSRIRRQSEDTICGTADCTIYLVQIYKRDCELEVLAVRRKQGSLDGH